MTINNKENISGLTEQERSDIYQKYVDSLYSYGVSLHFEHAQCMDAIHDVFVKLFTSDIELSSEKTKFFLFRSLKNRLIDIYRRNRKVSYYSDLAPDVDYDFSLNINVLDNIIAEEDKENVEKQIEELLSHLTGRQREAIYLRYFQNLSYEEIGDLLGMTGESVRKLVYRGISKIRESNSILYLILLLSVR